MFGESQRPPWNHQQYSTIPTIETSWSLFMKCTANIRFSTQILEKWSHLILSRHDEMHDSILFARKQREEERKRWGGIDCAALEWSDTILQLRDSDTCWVFSSSRGDAWCDGKINEWLTWRVLSTNSDKESFHLAMENLLWNEKLRKTLKILYLCWIVEFW